jgi:hypothetical protein
MRAWGGGWERLGMSVLQYYFVDAYSYCSVCNLSNQNDCRRNGGYYVDLVEKLL